MTHQHNEHKTSNGPTRREFLQTAAAGSAAWAMSAVSYGRVVGANDRIRIGIIGCGDRGMRAHMPGVHQHAAAMNAEITAVCDPWRVRREMAAELTRAWYGRPARQCVSYRDLVALDDVDAVMIASCDHQHTTHLIAAAETKKDVYCEKPLGMDFAEVIRACDKVRESGVVCQVGTQVRSWPTSRGCQALYRTGALGRVSRIEQVRNAPRPYWYSYLKEADEKDVDWKEFLMDRPLRPFRANLFTGWYGYRDFSDGPIPGLGSHFVDLVHFITGAKYPQSVVAAGGTFTWRDEHEFTCPDQVQAAWTYPDGFMVSYSTNFGNGEGSRIQFCGDQGVLHLTPWTKPTVSGQGGARRGPLGEEQAVEPVEGPDHFLDWLQCIRSRGECNASIEAGYQHAVAVLMAVRACDTGRRQVYDHARREIREG